MTGMENPGGQPGRLRNCRTDEGQGGESASIREKVALLAGDQDEGGEELTKGKKTLGQRDGSAGEDAFR